MKSRFLFFVFLCFIYFTPASFAGSALQDITSSTSETALIFGLSVSLWEKIIVAIVSAILAFIGAILLERYKRKREPKKQISYEKILHKGIVAIDDEISGKTAVLYRDAELKEPYRLSFNFVNSGNSLIKNQYIRFKFPDGCIIVDTYLAPIPEPELGFEEISDLTISAQEKRFKISHFEVGANINLRFILSGSLDRNVEMYPFNEDGGVFIVERSAAQALTDGEKLNKFLWLISLMWILPNFFHFIPIDEISDLGTGILRFGIAIYLVPLIKPVVRIIADRVIKIGSTSPEGAHIEIHDIESASTVNTVIDQ